MKMKLMSRWALSAMASGLFIASGTMAQTTDNYAEDFEGFTAGALIVEESTMWSGAETNAGLIVATNYTANYVGGAFPIAYDHAINDTALWFENTLTNTITVGTESQTNWIDMVLSPTFADKDEAPDFPVGSIAAVYFKSNGTLVVSHTPDNSTTPIEWVEIPQVQVGEDDWIRLTIAANMKDGGLATTATRLYQIYINGVVVTNAVAFQEVDRTSGGGGSWFGTAVGLSKKSISNLVFQGSGYVDDLVVKNEKTLTQEQVTVDPWPTLESGPYVYGTALAAIAGDLTNGVATAGGDPVAGTFSFTMAGSTIPPVGTNSYGLRFDPDAPEDYTSASGGSVDVEVTALGITITAHSDTKIEGETYTFTGNEYNVDPALVVGNGDEITDIELSSAGTNALAAVGTYDIVVTNAVGTGLGNYDITYVYGELAVVSEAGDEPSGDWFTETGLTSGNLDDDRGDGMTVREAWLASVDPNDSNDLFRVSKIENVDGTNYIEWVSVYADTNLPPFGIWARTNLMDTTPMLRDTYPRPAGPPSATPVTNTWWEEAPAYPIYYRLVATNAPSAN